MSGSKSFASFTNRTVYLSRPPGFRRAFDAAERNGRFGRIQCQRGEKNSSRGKRRVLICRETVRVKVGGKAILASFLKVEGRGTLVGAKDRSERGMDRRIGRWSEPKSPSTSQEQDKAREKGAKKMSGEERWRRVGVSGSLRGRRSEMTQSNTSSSRGSEVPLESQRE